MHNCATDHIANWPNGAREFGDAKHTIRLVFAPCTHAPERTLVLGLELVGSVYEKIQRDANVYLPLPHAGSPPRNVDDSAPSDRTVVLRPPAASNATSTSDATASPTALILNSPPLLFDANAVPPIASKAVQDTIAPEAISIMKLVADMNSLRDEIHVLRARDVERERKVEELEKKGA